MAVFREPPYGNQHFLVDLGLGPGEESSFSEIIMPDIRIDAIEYRTGTDKETGTRKIPGLAHYDNVTLRRGLTGSMTLYNWINDVRNGNVNARRTVVISLQSEDMTAIVFTWRLFRAWPVRYGFDNLNAKGTDVAIEELVLAYDRLEIE